MIPATTNYATALAAFNKGRIVALITIAGYSRAFSNALSGTVGSLNNVSVPGKAAPWICNGIINTSFDPTYPTGANAPGPPVSYPVSPGTTLTLTWTSGLVEIGGAYGYHDAAGVPGGGGNSAPHPGQFIATPMNGGCLIGAFADASGQILGSPFYIGNSATVGPAPSGTTQLLMGCNDVSNFGDNYSAWNINVGGFTANAFPWLVSIDDLEINVNDLDGGADVVALNFTVQDVLGQLTADFPSFVFEGAQVTLRVGFDGLSIADFATVYNGFIDSVSSVNSNNEYYFSCVDVSAKLQQVIYQTGDDGAPTDSKNMKTLSAHPLDILIDICTAQVVNADGSKGLPGGFLDTSKLIAYRDGPFSGLTFVFHLSTPPSALDFIKSQILKPLGGYLWVNSAGQLTVNFFYPLTGATALQTLGPDTWLSIPEAEQTDMVNTVQMSFDKDDATAAGSGNYFANSTNEYGPSVQKYGLFGEQSIQADGVRSAFQGFFIASLTSQLIFSRYGFKNLKFDQSAPESLWNTMRLEPGDVVAVTHPLVPDRQFGVMGVSNKLFEILHRRLNFTEGKVTLTMLEASYLTSFGAFLIAPDGEASYPSASPADEAKYLFLSDDNGLYPGVGGGGGGGGTVVAVTNIENTLTGWKPVCVLPSCNPGGTGIPSATSQTVGVTPPGGGAPAMKLTIRGGRDTNCLWTNIVAGSFNGCTYVHSDFYIYLGNNTACIEAFEIDLFNFDTDSNTEWMWGNQWNQHRGIWQTWDQLHNRWEDTSATIGLTPGAWTHVVQDMHRVVGDPGLYFDSVTVNGVKQVWNQKFPSGPLPAGWASVIGIQFQMDIGAAGSGGADAEIFIRNVNFTGSTAASSDPGSVKANTLG